MHNHAQDLRLESFQNYSVGGGSSASELYNVLVHVLRSVKYIGIFLTNTIEWSSFREAVNAHLAKKFISFHENPMESTHPREYNCRAT
jgi:hypothetical protein